MSDDPRSEPYDVVGYLKSKEDIAGYLQAAIEDGSEQILLLALQDAVRAANLIMPSEAEKLPDNLSDLSVTKLVVLLHELGFELTVRAKPRNERP